MHRPIARFLRLGSIDVLKSTPHSPRLKTNNKSAHFDARGRKTAKCKKLLYRSVSTPLVGVLMVQPTAGRSKRDNKSAHFDARLKKPTAGRLKKRGKRRALTDGAEQKGVDKKAAESALSEDDARAYCPEMALNRGFLTVLLVARGSASSSRPSARWLVSNLTPLRAEGSCFGFLLLFVVQKSTLLTAVTGG